MFGFQTHPEFAKEGRIFINLSLLIGKMCISKYKYGTQVNIRARNSRSPGSQCDEKWRRATADPKYRSPAGDHLFLQHDMSKLPVFTISRDVENGQQVIDSKQVGFTLCNLNEWLQSTRDRAQILRDV